MKTISELIRDHLLEIAPIIDSTSYEGLKVQQWSERFEQLMRNRLVMGAIRFGGLHAGRPKRMNLTEFHTEYIQAKLDLYKETGNIEFLVDVANLALVEFEIGDHPKRHFKAEDRND